MYWLCFFGFSIQKIHIQTSFPVNIEQVFINNFNSKIDVILFFLLNLSDFTTQVIIKKLEYNLAWKVTFNINHVCYKTFKLLTVKLF